MLVVFDLDFTLWDCGGVWCDCTNPPYTKRSGQLFDSLGRAICLYPDSLSILTHLKSKGIKMAVASRTSEPSWARQLMQLLQIDHLFDYKEIYPSSKVAHFQKLAQQSGVAYSEMYFFDDEERNIVDVSKLQVNCKLVQNGIDRHQFSQLTNISIQ